MKKILTLLFLCVIFRGEIFLCKEEKEKEENINRIYQRIYQISYSTGLSEEYVINLNKKGYSFSCILLLGKIYQATGIEPVLILKIKEDDEKFKEIAPYFGIKTLGKYKTIGEYLKGEHKQLIKETKKVKKP